MSSLATRHLTLSTRDADELRLLDQVAAIKDRIKERIGRRIRDAREAKGWRQKHLANALPGDVEPSSVSRWERGMVRPGDDMLDAIASALEVDVSYFLAPDDPVEQTPDLMAALNGKDTSASQLDRIEDSLNRLHAKLDRLLPDGDVETALAEGLQIAGLLASRGEGKTRSRSGKSQRRSPRQA